MKVEELCIYPLKSARAQKLNQLLIGQEGPIGDRQWMIVDEDGKFISQRTLPKLATVEVFYENSALTVGFQKMFLKIPMQNSLQRKIKVQVWNDSFEAALEPDLYSQALSQYLGVKCRLVRYAPYSQRGIHSFSDRRPLLLVNSASFNDLNTRLAEPVPLDRFRANVVVSGVEPYAEDRWQKIRLGNVVFSQPKACTRCAVITIDQVTGIPSGPEPLKTLSSYRREGKQVFFGSLWIPENEGVIKTGDEMEFLS